MAQKLQRFVIPMTFVGIMFFAIGFALGINSFLLPVLQGALKISAGVSYLIIAATFLPFLIFGYPASLVIKAIGYKRTMSLSFALFAIAFALFIPAATQGSFALFLFASFVCGAANAFLQASVNPYITILGPLESAAKRMSVMGICNKFAWPIAPIFLSWVIGKDIIDVQLSDITTPFMIIIAVFILLGVMSLLAPLPEVKATGEDEQSAEDCPYANSKKSVWEFPHLILGCVALFLYVGVETLALATTVDYATSLSLVNPEQYATLPTIGMVIGYICGILLIPKYLSQAKALVICSVLGIVGSVAVVLLPAQMSIYAVLLMALGCSLMWPALWPLAMADLGKFTKAGSSLLVVAIVGGAVIPTLFGFLKDSYGPQNAYWVALPIYLFILYYGTAGYKIRRVKN